jgi:hypothetical protein
VSVSASACTSSVVVTPVLSTVNVTKQVTSSVASAGSATVVNVTSTPHSVVTPITSNAVVNTNEHVHRISVSSLGVRGEQGIQGIPGTGTSTTTVTAGEAINGHHIITRVVGLAYHADKGSPTQQSQILGLSLHAGVVAADVDVLTMGYATEPSWSWTPDKPLFLGANGLMTEVPPITGFLIQVAQSISPTEVWVSIKMGIALH